ncbi:hypothetical protein MOMA_05165 [Moraxella macacae 0408225]|uniref:Zinc-finger domain-containing protein n=1 Tax=Moraxella macacae 0408225 TaxID=1230338 RepID=L2FA42_9GAMM|nr:hypothetical protein [Moraxella macacae]ELA09765.1 hypothetical protein MOMA_05165 [Moraxella macacae 0408225]
MPLKKIPRHLATHLTLSCEQATKNISMSHEVTLPKSTQLRLKLHRMLCKECEQFYQNDKELSRIIDAHKQQ